MEYANRHDDGAHHEDDVLTLDQIKNLATGKQRLIPTQTNAEEKFRVGLTRRSFGIEVSLIPS